MRPIFCAFLFALLACGATDSDPKNKPVFTRDDFSKTIEIDGRAIALAGIDRPVRLTVLPDKGVLMFYEAAIGSTKKWIHFYSLDSVKPIRSVINNGEGEGELLGTFQLQYDGRNGGEIYITDIIKQQILVYKADSLIAGNEKPFKIIGKPFTGYHGRSVNADRLMRSVIINDSYHFIDTRASALNHSRMLLNKYRSDLSVADSFGFYPKTAEDIAPHMLSQVFDGCLNISDNNKYIVFNGLTTDYLAVYDTSGKMIASAVGPGELNAEYKIEKGGVGERVVSLSKHKGYGARGQIVRDSIYVLYDGKDNRSNDEHVSDLFQFNTQLTPGIRYKLNLPIFDFQIDWRTKRLYGLRRQGSTPQMVIYQL